MPLFGFHAIRGNLASGCLFSFTLFERLGRGVIFNFIGLLIDFFTDFLVFFAFLQ